MLQGARGGNGVLVWLRFADSVATGEWPLLQRADTAARGGGAVAGVRFMVGDIAHGAPLDSGGVSVTRASPVLSVRVQGSGRDVVGAEWVAVDASFEAVPLGAGSVSCVARP